MVRVCKMLSDCCGGCGLWTSQETQIVSAWWLCKCFLCNDFIGLWFLQEEVIDFKTFNKRPKSQLRVFITTPN